MKLTTPQKTITLRLVTKLIIIILMYITYKLKNNIGYFFFLLIFNVVADFIIDLINEKRFELSRKLGG